MEEVYKGLKVSATFDKDSWINVGETVNVGCFVDNTNGTKNIVSTNIIVKRSMKVNYGSMNLQKTINDTIIKREFRGMDKG